MVGLVRALRFPMLQSLCSHLQLVGLLFALCLMGLHSFCHAQEAVLSDSDAGLVPEAPRSHVLDEANLFHEHGEILKEVQNSLHTIKGKYGYSVYLAIYYNVYDLSLQDRADILYDAWVGETGNGMVVVYQIDPVVTGDNPAMAYTEGSALDPELSDSPAFIPANNMDAMLSKVLASIEDKSQKHIPLITTLVYGLEHEIERYHQVKPVQWHDAENLSFMGFFLGLIVACVIAAVVFWKVQRPVDAKSRRVYYFPEVKVGRRLGAPYGGGWVSQRTFVPASSRR